MSAVLLDWSDRAVGRLLALLQWLVVPLTLLLAVQWPLRDLVQAYSREANDMAQWIFALYVGAGLTAATRARAHLAADVFAGRLPAGWRAGTLRWGGLLAVGSWSLAVLIAGSPAVWQSVRQFEGFPDTYNPGYFLIKLACWLMALLALVQAVLDAAAGRR